jgi:hypothetical protein
MNKLISFISVAALALALSVTAPVVSHAEEDDNGAYTILLLVGGVIMLFSSTGAFTKAISAPAGFDKVSDKSKKELGAVQFQKFSQAMGECEHPENVMAQYGNAGEATRTFISFYNSKVFEAACLQ